jgi:hypothetical protein
VKSSSWNKALCLPFSRRVVGFLGEVTNPTIKKADITPANAAARAGISLMVSNETACSLLDTWDTWLLGRAEPAGSDGRYGAAGKKPRKTARGIREGNKHAITIEGTAARLEGARTAWRRKEAK